MTCPNTGLSRCQPMPAPGRYSVTNACCSDAGFRFANEAARSRKRKRNSGTSSRRLQSSAPHVVITRGSRKGPWLSFVWKPRISQNCLESTEGIINAAKHFSDQRRARLTLDQGIHVATKNQQKVPIRPNSPFHVR